jgi:hypothetical protein
MMAIGTIDVEVAYVGNESDVFSLRKDIVALDCIFFDLRGMVGLHNLESYPGTKRRVSSKPYCRNVSSPDLMDYAISAVVVQIAKVNWVEPSYAVTYVIFYRIF